MKPLLSVLVLVAMLAGCADFSIRKVPQSHDYKTWTDGQQKAADEMVGFRFYGRRPFVAVHTPFPVSSTTFVLNGQVSADGRFVAIDMAGRPEVPDSAAWQKVLSTVGWVTGGQSIELPSTALSVRSGVRLVDSEVADAEAGEDDADGGQKPASGIGTYKVRTDLDGVAVLPFRKYFDIAYLPDHEEQYVVDAKANFGNAQVDMTWSPGNTLLGMDATVDNTAITGPLLTAYRKLVEAAGSAVVSRINPMGAAEGVAQAQGGGAESMLEGGAPVTLIFHVVRFAAPGVYPILKPHELDAVQRAPSDQIAIVGMPPAPCVAYGVYEEVFIEAATASPTARYIGPRFADEAGGNPLDTSVNGQRQANKTDDELAADLRADHALDGYKIVTATRDGSGVVAIELQLTDASKEKTPQELKQHFEDACKAVTGESFQVKIAITP